MILLQIEFWDVIQNLIPYVRQMVLAHISVEGWIVHPDVNSFFYGSDEALVLSPHNAEILNGGIMTCDFWWSYIGEGAFRCSLNLSPKVLDDPPMYLSSQSTLWHLNL